MMMNKLVPGCSPLVDFIQTVFGFVELKGSCEEFKKQNKRRKRPEKPPKNHPLVDLGVRSDSKELPELNSL
jgi:hypothetical protein